MTIELSGLQRLSTVSWQNRFPAYHLIIHFLLLGVEKSRTLQLIITLTQTKQLALYIAKPRANLPNLLLKAPPRCRHNDNE